MFTYKCQAEYKKRERERKQWWEQQCFHSKRHRSTLLPEHCLNNALTVLQRWWERRFHSKTGGERLVGETMDARGEVTPLEFESNLPARNFKGEVTT